MGDSKRIWGAAYKSKDNTTNPIFISIGTKISLDTAIEVVTHVCKFRIPEPVFIYFYSFFFYIILKKKNSDKNSRQNFETIG